MDGNITKPRLNVIVARRRAMISLIPCTLYHFNKVTHILSLFIADLMRI
jgi:hypothetical protein